jgi:UDP-N-acetylglucosamine:LPS N-acetylglucosamine transferase
MTPTEKFFEFDDLVGNFESPVLVVSTIVGRGAYVIGEAIQERLAGQFEVHHIPIEELVPDAAVTEDLKRYKFISNRLPWLLYLIYKVPVFYYRKYAREKWFSNADLPRLRETLEERRIQTVICVSHRPAFWVATVKNRRNLPVQIWGVGVEFGRNLGWQYQFWKQIDGFLSPVFRKQTGIRLPEHVRFYPIRLPVRKGYRELARTPGNPNSVLLVCGAWGQGPLAEMVDLLTTRWPMLKVHVLCGENQDAFSRIRQLHGENSNVQAHSTTPSLYRFLQECGSVISKPGMATLLESHAAQRKIFLLRGMPVAEDNNARFAIRHMDAEWFSPEAFERWHRKSEESKSALAGTG